ncbi:hypothetical protein Hanom_Chr09g00817921 [Helianthus anomalus]
MLYNQTPFLLHSTDIWYTSSRADVCSCGPQTADLLHLKKQTAPKSSIFANENSNMELYKNPSVRT